MNAAAMGSRGITLSRFKLWIAYGIISLAGREAQRKFNARSWRRYHTEEDEQHATASLRHLTKPADDEIILDGLMELTSNLLARPRVWRAVEALAEELVAPRKLGGREVDRIIRASRRNSHRV